MPSLRRYQPDQVQGVAQRWRILCCASQRPALPQLEDGTMHLLTDPFDGILMGETAENLAEKYEVSRELQDDYSVQSQERARVAIDEGRFKEQILPIEVRKGRETVTFDTDEHPRSTDMETLGKLRTIFRDGGSVTAGTPR